MNSAYNQAFGLDYKDGDFSLERVPYIHIASDLDTVHTVLDGETIYSIAYRYYSDSGLWYKITDTNSIYDPIRQIVPGLQLIIPHGREK